MEDDTVPTPLSEIIELPAMRARPCLTVLVGTGAGSVHRLDGNCIVLGRSSEADIQVDTDGVSRKHAEILCSENGDVTIQDLRSTNGVWVEGQRVLTRRLTNGDRIQLGSNSVFQFSYQSEAQEEIQRKLYESATRDPLTSALNRRVFDEHLARELSHARRHGNSVSLLLLDIDHFKSINDKYGHRAGDYALRQLGELIAASIRFEDLFCRIGGEEFAVLTRDPGDVGPAHFGERLRHLVESQYLSFEGERLAITVSIGIATFAPEYPTPDALLGAADEALYAAKHAGRNRVCVAD